MKKVIDKQIGKQILVSLDIIQKAINNLRGVVEEAMQEQEEVNLSKNMKVFLNKETFEKYNINWE